MKITKQITGLMHRSIILHWSISGLSLVLKKDSSTIDAIDARRRRSWLSPIPK